MCRRVGITPRHTIAHIDRQVLRREAEIGNRHIRRNDWRGERKVLAGDAAASDVNINGLRREASNLRGDEIHSAGQGGGIRAGGCVELQRGCRNRQRRGGCCRAINGDSALQSRGNRGQRINFAIATGVVGNAGARCAATGLGAGGVHSGLLQNLARQADLAAQFGPRRPQQRRHPRNVWPRHARAIERRIATGAVAGR